MAHLKVVSGAGAGQVWEVKEPRCVLGRHPDCDIPVDHLDASRHHAQIVALGSDHFVEDLHSRNGTWLNGEQLAKRRQLQDGDLIRMSEMVVEFHRAPLGGPPKAVPSAFVEEQPGPAHAPAAVAGDADCPTARMRAELDAIRRITQSLRTTLVLDELFPVLLESLFAIFPAADRGFVVLRAEDGVPTPRWIKTREGRGSAETRLSSAIVERVMDSQQAVLSADAAEDFRFKNSESVAEVPIRSVLCAPLVDSEGACTGALQIDTLDQRGGFREADLHVFVAVAAQASIAFDHARLHEQALRQGEIERDLELADRIQREFLPTAAPRVAGYRFFDFYRPASSVGGDYYNYVTLPDGRVAVVVADVVGHGLDAAMLTARFAAEVRCQLLTAAGAAEAMAGLNRSLAEAIGEGHYIALVLILLDPKSGSATVVNAGHPAPVFCAPGVPPKELGAQQRGCALGVSDAAVYEGVSIQMPPGGLLAVFTDGIHEATNAQREAFGLTRVCRLLEAAGGDPARFGRSLVDDLLQFVGGHPQSDDMCLVCFGRE